MESIPRSTLITRLRLAHQDKQAADRHYREQAIRARQEGLTNQAIADVYGKTEGAIRHLIKTTGPTT